MDQAQVGDSIRADGWKIARSLLPGDTFTDASFPGCQFRYEGPGDIRPALNVKITGRKAHWNGVCWQYRCRIEFVGDGEPSTFTGGWLFSKTFK